MAEGQLNLYIKTVSNAVYPVTVSASIAVSELKRIVSDAANVATDRQRLIYRGRVLQDEAVLSSYNIEDGHTVHLAIRPENIQHSSSVPARTSATAGSTQPQQPRLAVPDFRGQTLMSGDSIGLSTLDEPNTMEHVRQNLLTLHTLLSTSEVPAMQSARQVIGDPSTMNVEEPIAPAVPTGSRERRFYVGQWVDVKDTVNQWLEATVMDINEADRTIFVHYNGWPERWDEWISFDSPRVCPFRSRTPHSTLSPYLSPTPNVTLSRAPVTGANDVRTLLPEMARWFRALQPVVEEAARLAEQSLQDRPTVSAYNPVAAAAENVSVPGTSSTSSATGGNLGLHRRTSAAAAASRSTPAGGAGPGSSSRGPSQSVSQTQPARTAPGMPWETVGRRPPPPPAQLRPHGGPSAASVDRTGTAPAAAAAAAVESDTEPQVSGEKASPEQQSRQVTGIECDNDQQPSPGNRRQRPRQWSNPRMPAFHLGFDAEDGGSMTAFPEVPCIEGGAEMLTGDGDEGAASRSAGPTRKRSADSIEPDSSEYSPDTSLGLHVSSSESATMAVDDQDQNQRSGTAEETSADREARLRTLAQELCPLVDRFGRVLADLAPHLWELGALDASLGHTPPPANSPGSPFNFEASLLSLLRNRPPSPPPQRAYRTPIAMQTRIGGVGGVGGLGTGAGALSGMSLLPGVTVHRGNANTNNFINTLLGDLGLLGGATVAPSGTGTGIGASTSTTAQALSDTSAAAATATTTTTTTGGAPTSDSSAIPPAPQGATGARTGPTPRHVDIHISFLQPPGQSSLGSSVTRTQERSAAAANALIQAQIAENIRARTELLSSQTQELNSYSQAIEEMLRRLGADPDATPAGERTSSASGGGSIDRGRSGSGEDGIEHGIMPPHSALRTRRPYASSIRPGPISSLTSPTARSTVAPTSGGTTQTASASDLTPTYSTLTASPPPGSRRQQVAQLEGLVSAAAAERPSDLDVPDLVGSSDEEEDEGGLGDSDEVEYASDDFSDGGEDADEPLHDLQPTASLTEYGRSLMDSHSAMDQESGSEGAAGVVSGDHGRSGVWQDVDSSDYGEGLEPLDEAEDGEARQEREPRDNDDELNEDHFPHDSHHDSGNEAAEAGEGNTASASAGRAASDSPVATGSSGRSPLGLFARIRRSLSYRP